MSKYSFLFVSAVACGLFSACSTPAKYVDANSPEGIVSMDQIDIQDWSLAADSMIHSMIDTGVVNRVPVKPAILAISRMVNNTSEHVDVDLLTKKIRTSLLKTGQVETTMMVGTTTAEDPLAQELVNKENVRKPDFILSGKIIEANARAGKIKQVSYVFQMTLTSTVSGNAVWEEEKTISKQGSENTVGW